MSYKEDHKSSFLIMINEEQRKALAELIKERQDDQDFDDVITDDGSTTEHPLKYWVGMLEDLPNEDQTHINPITGKKEQLINGFCL